MARGARIIYIAGAGIGGLTLALALAKFGASVVVLERNADIQEFGAGLQLSPNARKVLNRLGLERALGAQAFEPEAIDIYPFGAVRPLAPRELKGPMAQRFGAPYAVMHRADLAQALFQACKRFANVDILFGARAWDVVSHAGGISVTVDEADGKTRNARAFAFIGADGVNSRTRTDVLMGPAARYSGFVAWRTVLPAGRLDPALSPDRTSLLLAPNCHAVCYPLPHRDQLNVVLVARAARDLAVSPEPAAGPRLPPAVGRDRHFRAILHTAESWGLWPLSTVETDEWYDGGVGLVGDAAHAMLPFQAQGAAMAIEDAAVLAPLLMTAPEPASALQRYQALRRDRVERVRRLSASNAFAFHLDWPMSLARDAVLRVEGRTGHLSRLAWLYGYDPAPEPELAPPPRPARNRALH